eukprot:COSAG02_NODE_252_length_26996_cov_29.825607_22_plen_207_part_00
MLHQHYRNMCPVGWRVRLLGSGEGEVRTVFSRSFVLAARRGHLRGHARGCGGGSVVLTTFLMIPSYLSSINCLANEFGEEDLATLLTAIEGTSVRSLCGLTEEQTVADFSGQNLWPIDMKIMAAEYGFQGFIAAVARLAHQQLGPGYVLLLSWWLGTEFSAALNSVTRCQKGRVCGHHVIFIISLHEDKFDDLIFVRSLETLESLR